MSYVRLIYHIIFRTKSNKRSIPIEHERELYNYLYGVMQQKGATVFRIGGMPDHIHIAVQIPPQIAVSDFVRDIKRSSSRWLMEHPDFPIFEGWGRKYGAFSYAYNDKETLIHYIKNQKPHHRVVTFEEELRAIFGEFAIPVDERYFLSD